MRGRKRHKAICIKWMKGVAYICDVMAYLCSRMRLLTLSKFFLTFLSTGLFGQEVKLLDKSNSRLADNDLLSVAIDKNGNKWIGTSKFGLQKFDGRDFVTFDKSNSGIKGDCVSPVFVDSKGNVWVSFSHPTDGIAKYDGSKWRVFDEMDLNIKELSVISICEDQDGVLYFGGSSGVVSYKDNVWANLLMPADNITVRAIDVSSEGSIAIGHNSGLLIYSKNKWIHYNIENSNLRLPTVRAVKFKPSGELLVGYGGGFGEGGVSIIDDGTWEHWNKTNSKISDHMVRDIEIDSNQTIWMATNNGLIKMNGSEITPIFFRNGLYKNVILDISSDKEGLWIATNFGLINYEP